LRLRTGTRWRPPCTGSKPTPLTIHAMLPLKGWACCTSAQRAAIPARQRARTVRAQPPTATTSCRGGAVSRKHRAVAGRWQATPPYAGGLPPPPANPAGGAGRPVSCPWARGGLFALRLLRHAETALAARGVGLVQYSSPAARPCHALYRRLGAQPTETIWHKTLRLKANTAAADRQEETQWP